MDKESDNELELFDKVDQKIERVHTQSLDISFNELLSMYNDRELIIDPDFQRLFRWTDGQQSRFIESLLLEMPIPPIFVIETEDGIYELIDGLQRISTYLRLRGQLNLPEGINPDKAKPLELKGCDLVPELNGYMFGALPNGLKIKLKRSFIRMEIIRKESDQKLRYYMFKRLNSGGAQLEEQEMRNATIRLLGDGEKISSFLTELSNYTAFKKCTALLTPKKQDERYDQELVLRFLAFKNWLEHYEHAIGEFLTSYMEAIADHEVETDFNYEEEREAFQKTFTLLDKALGEYAFSAKNEQENFISGFRSLHYEAFVLGVQPWIDDIDPADEEAIQKFSDALEKLKENKEFQELTTGGGKNYKHDLQKRIEYVQDWLNKHYGS